MFQFDLRQYLSAGTWPWIIAVIATGLLMMSVNETLNYIPQSLLARANSTARDINANNLTLSIDGRDLQLEGVIDNTINRDAFVDQFRQIAGIRVVKDNLTVFDPVEHARHQLSTFQTALANIDLSRVVFEPSRASITAESGPVLQQLAQLIKAYPQFRIRVSGHTDNSGRAEVNLRISKERAVSVKQYLVQQQVDPTQITAQGYGATRPIADNGSSAGRAANRRIEVNYVN